MFNYQMIFILIQTHILSGHIKPHKLRALSCLYLPEQKLVRTSKKLISDMILYKDWHYWVYINSITACWEIIDGAGI